MSNHEVIPGEFDFEIGRWDADADSWFVQLPHQCDEWSISPYDSTHEQAVAAMEKFLAEGQAALERLRAMPA